MHHSYQKFLEGAEKKSFDPEHRQRLDYNIGVYDRAVEQGKTQYRDLELARRRAANLKHKAINRLESSLNEFASNLTRRNGKVIWCPTEKDARQEIMNIVKHSRAQVIVKQKTMVSEELELNELFEKNKRTVLETDLGEYIVQIAGEKPYHILTPAMHKSRGDVSALFHEKFGLPPDASPSDIAGFVREKLRTEFLRADIGITGANFLVADSGAVALTENEGNGLLSIGFPRIHIVVAGIEKVIPSLEDLDLFLPLLATHATGQFISVYNNIVFGPRKAGEPDGPEEMYVILIDNRRTEVLKYKEQRKALSCIRCGACLNACPVYRSVGGYTYGAVYSGPVGSVISPHYKGARDYNHLSFASSLCGACTEVCAVKIPLHELLLQNRRDAVLRKFYTRSWKRAMKAWRYAMLNRWVLEKTPAGIKNRALKILAGKKWGPRRTLPRASAKSFRELWKDRLEERS
jgi:L-lactate dehydrogenase complex protein LldF